MEPENLSDVPRTVEAIEEMMETTLIFKEF